MKRVLVATSGGDCPGLNAVIRGVVKRAAQEGDWEVLGSIQAYNGILWEPTEVKVLDEAAVAGIHYRGGTIIETTNKGALSLGRCITNTSDSGNMSTARTR